MTFSFQIQQTQYELLYMLHRLFFKGQCYTDFKVRVRFFLLLQYGLCFSLPFICTRELQTHSLATMIYTDQDSCGAHYFN